MGIYLSVGLDDKQAERSWLTRPLDGSEVEGGFWRTEDQKRLDGALMEGWTCRSLGTRCRGKRQDNDWRR